MYRYVLQWWVSHVIHMHQSCHAYERVMVHVAYMNESCHFYERVMVHVAYMNESCYSYERVMLHVNESRHAYEWVILHVWIYSNMPHAASHMRQAKSHVRLDSFIWVTWLIHTCDMTQFYERHDSFVYVTCRIICAKWLIHMCDMTHSYVWHDSFICETWLIHTWDITHSEVCHASFIRVSWLIHRWVVTHSFLSIWRTSPILHRIITITKLIHTCGMTHPCILSWLIHGGGFG